MSADHPSSATHATLSQQVEAIERDAEALGRALRKSRQSRLLLFVVLVPFVLVFSYLFLNLGKQFTEESKQKDLARFALNQFFELRQTESQEEDWEPMMSKYQDLLLKEVDDLGKSSMPIIEAAFRNQIEQDTGKFTTMFNDQRQLLVSNLQARVEPLVQERYQAVLKQHEHILLEEFDEYDDAQKERMLVHFNIAMDQLLKKYYSEEIERQMNTLYATYDHFPVADPADGMSDQELLIGTLVETLQVKLEGDVVVPDVDRAPADEESEPAPATDGEPVLEDAEGTPAEETEQKSEDDAQENKDQNG